MKRSRKFGILILVGVLSFFSAVPVQAQEKAMDNRTGFYAEVAPILMVPFAQARIRDNFIIGTGQESAQLGLGPGFQIGAGYDFRYVSLGAKFYWASLEAKPLPNSEGFFFDDSVGLGALDVETKIYVLELFEVDTGPFRPFILASGGLGAVAGNGSLDFGASSKFAGGVQWQFHKNAYLSLESGIRSLWAGDGCDSGTIFTQTEIFCGNRDLHSVSTALNLGFRF